MQWTQKNVKYRKKFQLPNIQKISYPKARKLVEKSVVTTTYANAAKPNNSSTQNQGITQYEMINLIKKPENANRIKRKFDQPDNQAPCWTRSKEKPLILDQQSWRP